MKRIAIMICAAFALIAPAAYADSTAGAAAGAQAGALAGSKAGAEITLIQEAAPIPTSTTLRNTPSVALPNIYPTSPCMGSSSVGGSGPGFSLGIGTSWKDDDCGKRETARAFAGMNMRDDAVQVLCSSSYAGAANACKALAKKAEAEQPKVAETDKRKTDATVRDDRRPTMAAIQQPSNCTADPFIAGRTGMTRCK